MADRSISPHSELLKLFGSTFKKNTRSDLRFWCMQDETNAEARFAAYTLVLSDLKQCAEECGVDLVDLGLEGYEVPKPIDTRD